MPEEEVTGAQAQYVPDGGRLDIVDQLTEMAERLQLGDGRERNIRPRPVMMVPAWAPDSFVTHERPEDSTTEIAFYNLDADVPRERIAALLGGGNRVRDIRRSGSLTFVALWSPDIADAMMIYGIRS